MAGTAERLAPLQQMVASGTGAVFTSIMMTPFDVVKTRLQAQSAVRAGALARCVPCYIMTNGMLDHLCICPPGGFTTALHPGRVPTPPFTGTLDALQKIVLYEGPASLWRGVLPTFATSIPSTMIYFTSYDAIKSRLDLENPLTPLFSGMAARAGAVCVVSPLEMIRTHVQSYSKHHGIKLSESLRAEGVRGLWRGLTATLLRDVPFSGIYFFGYENIKRFLHPAARSRDVVVSSPPYSVAVFAGAVSGTIAATLTLPFDVAKTQLQSRLGQNVVPVGSERPPIPTTAEILRTIYKQQGVPGLFVGLTPRVAKVAPACALMIGTYEVIKEYFFVRNRLSGRMIVY